jgi:hypothetical protein
VTYRRNIRARFAQALACNRNYSACTRSGAGKNSTAYCADSCETLLMPDIGK